MTLRLGVTMGDVAQQQSVIVCDSSHVLYNSNFYWDWMSQHRGHRWNAASIDKSTGLTLISDSPLYPPVKIHLKGLRCGYEARGVIAAADILVAARLADPDKLTTLLIRSQKVEFFRPCSR